MIHVCTVHWQVDHWIDIQEKYLNRFMKAPFRVYAFCTGIPVEHSNNFFYCSRENIESHQSKLNILAAVYQRRLERRSILADNRWTTANRCRG